MGLARSFQRDAACAWFCLCDLRRQLAQPLSGNQGPRRNHALSRRGHWDNKELLRSMWNATLLRASPFGADGQRTSRTLQEPHGPRAALSRCHRRVAGLDISGRATRTSEGLSRNSMGAPIPKETTPSAWSTLIAGGSATDHGGRRRLVRRLGFRPREPDLHIRQLEGRQRSGVLPLCCELLLLYGRYRRKPRPAGRRPLRPFR